MERLTELCYKKSDGYYARCSEHCNDICDCNCEKWGEIVDRLGAYEDTSLEPEEIGLLAKQRDLYVDACGEIPLKRIRELVEADQEGRCVVLPCKVGDTVYMPVGTRWNKITGYEENECDGFHIARDGVLQIKAKCWTGNHGTYGVPSKTVFLTREEAEAALREAEG